MKLGYADTPEGQIHYLAEGSGKPLLLLHMTPRSSTMYRRLIPLLSRTRRVIAMDTLGFGNSDPAPARYMHIGDYAQNVAHFLDAIGVEQTDILSTLTGTPIAAEMAVQFPQRVRRLVLFAMPMWLTGEERTRRMAEARKAALITPKADGSHVQDALKFAFGRNVEKSSPVENVDFEYMNDSIVDALKAGPTMTEMALKVYAYISEARLPLIKASTLVVGLGGQLIPWYITPDRAKLMHSLIPDSKFVVIDGPDADHRIWYARPKEVAETILPFLEGESR